MILAGEAIAAMESLPARPVAELLAAGPILILAPHPDDESLGCGGLIAAAVAAGQPPFVLVLTDGAASHPNSRAYPPERLRTLREREARNAVKALGLAADRIGFLGLPDAASPMQGPELDFAVTAVLHLVQTHGIGTICATWAHDPHCDHLSAHLIAEAAAAAAGLRQLAYPVWGWTLPHGTPLPGPIPTGCHIDVTAHLPAKRSAIAAHRSQYAGLIDDDPDGFQLPANFLALFDRQFETFIDVPDADVPGRAGAIAFG